MTKLIFTTLLLIFTHGSAFTAVTHSYCNAKTTQSDCNSTAGCYWAYTNVDAPGTSPSSHCVACPAGTFNNGTIGETASSCLSCGNVGTGVKWKSNQLGLTSQSECAFTANCTAAQFFNNYQDGCTACTYKNNVNSVPPIIRYSTLTQGYSFEGLSPQNIHDYIESKVCASCGANSMVNTNGLGCNCYTNYHVSGGTNTETQNNSTDCVPNIYTITLNDNSGSNGSGTIKEVYNTKWTNVSGTSSITTVNIPSLTGHTFMGYFSNLNNRTPEIGIDGKLPASTTFSADTTLTAKWEKNQFTITYDVGDIANCFELFTSPQSCIYNSSGCNAANPAGCIHNGYLFVGWQCTSGCQDSNATINIGTNISTISDGKDMTLTANWQQCPAGSYCTDISAKLSCPAGSTSATGSSAITSCHMTGGTTQICDKDNKCFTLPETSDIYYHGGQ